MRAEGALGGQAVDLLRPRPALRRAQHDHRPARALGHAALARGGLDLADLVEHLVERRGHQLVHLVGVRALDEARRVAVALEQRPQLVVRDAGEHRRIGDLVAVEVQDRQHGAVGRRVEELVRVPARRERPGLRLAVADDAQREQIGVVEHRPVGVHERVPELAALVDGARASPAPRGSGCRPGRRTGGTAAAGRPRRGRCGGRRRCRSPRGRCWPRAPGRRGRGR